MFLAENRRSEGLTVIRARAVWLEDWELESSTDFVPSTARPRALSNKKTQSGLILFPLADFRAIVSRYPNNTARRVRADVVPRVRVE